MYPSAPPSGEKAAAEFPPLATGRRGAGGPARPRGEFLAPPSPWIFMGWWKWLHCYPLPASPSSPIPAWAGAAVDRFSG